MGPASSIQPGAGIRALAAFVKRPQAASSNRRYVYSIYGHLVGVNGNKEPLFSPLVRTIYYSGCPTAGAADAPAAATAVTGDARSGNRTVMLNVPAPIPSPAPSGFAEI